MPVSVDDTDDRCVAGNGDARVVNVGVIYDTDVWKAIAMRESVDDVGVSGLYR